jgi:hypothetical protein
MRPTIFHTPEVDIRGSHHCVLDAQPVRAQAFAIWEDAIELTHGAA